MACIAGDLSTAIVTTEIITPLPPPHTLHLLVAMMIKLSLGSTEQKTAKLKTAILSIINNVSDSSPSSGSHKSGPPPLTLTFVNKPDVLLMSWSESFCKVGRLMCGGGVVTLPVQAIEDDLRGWGAEDKNLGGLACIHGRKLVFHQ